MSLDKADKEVLGTAAKVVVTKDSTTIVGDGTTQEEVNKRVTQIKNQIEVCIVQNLIFYVSISYTLNRLYSCFSRGSSPLVVQSLLAALIFQYGYFLCACLAHIGKSLWMWMKML